MAEYSIYAISAVLGNFWQESGGLNPGIWQDLQVGSWTDLGVGYGLGQWTNVSENGRLYQMYVYFTENGMDLTSGYDQVDYFIIEDFWQAVYDEFPTLQSFLTTDSTDLEYLTYVFSRCWEGNTNQQENRQKYAQLVFDYLSEHYDDDTSGMSWYSSNSYLSESEALNNALLFYQYIGGTIPSGGKGTGTDFSKTIIKKFCLRNPALMVLSGRWPILYGKRQR